MVFQMTSTDARMIEAVPHSPVPASIRVGRVTP
jgi:hypothetical protein